MGFYPQCDDGLPSRSQQTVNHLAKSLPPTHPSFPLNSSPRSSYLEPTNRDNPSFHNVVTVQDFLRRSPKPPTKVYDRGRKRSRVNLRHPRLVGTSYPSGEQVPSKPNGKRRRTRTTRYSKDRVHSSNDFDGPPRSRSVKTHRTLAKRLRRAAILTHVKPGPLIVSSSPSSSRQPLEFVTDDICLPSASDVVPKCRALTLVDPRTSVPSCEPTFSVQKHTTIKSANCKPVTQWRIQPSNESARVAQLIHCLPLAFAPAIDTKEQQHTRFVFRQVRFEFQ